GSRPGSPWCSCASAGTCSSRGPPKGSGRSSWGRVSGRCARGRGSSSTGGPGGWAPIAGRSTTRWIWPSAATSASTGWPPTRRSSDLGRSAAVHRIVGTVGRRNRHNEPKPGSKRQAKIAARAAEREELRVEPRPFAGFAGECDMVAMREFVPSATARLTTVGDGRDVTGATVLPGAIAGLVRDPELGGEAFVGLQVQVHGPDVAADLAYAVDWARRAGGGETLSSAHPDDTTPALSDVVVPDAPLEVVVHDDFAWWVADGVEVRPEIAQAVRNAN